MSAYNYFIENQLPFVFRYKYSNPNIIRTVFIKEHKEDKGLIITSEAITGKIKSFKTDGIHFDTRDLLPTYDEVLGDGNLSEDEVSVTHFENEEDKKCNDNKHQFLKYAIENNKTIAFEYSWKDDVHIMAPYRFCNFGKSVLMYEEEEDAFRTYDIDQMRFVRIPTQLRDDEDLSESDEEVTESEETESDDEYLISSCDEDDIDDLDISAIDEINEWE